MAGPAYEWGPWRFEPSECRLMRDGVVLPLHAKTLDVLAELLRRAPWLVTKDGMLAAVWPDATVEEGNIAFHVAALRKAIDDGDEPSAIETVRGRGYRFTAPMTIHQLPTSEDISRVVAELPRELLAPGRPTAPVAPAAIVTPAAATQPPRLGLLAGAAVLAVSLVAGLAFAWLRVPATVSSVAMQRFEIANPGPGQDNFPDGLDAYLSSKLELAGVLVAPRVSAFAVLSGQLQPISGGFRVSVQLTRATDNARLWDWTFDQSADEGRPSVGVDDERSRLQGAVASHVADGVVRYLSLSGAAPVTR